MKQFWSAILALLVVVFTSGVSFAVSTAPKPKTTILTQGKEHATADGAKVKCTSDTSSGTIVIVEYPATQGPNAQPAHSTIEFKNGASGSVDGADGDNVTNTNDDCVVTVNGNNTQVNVNGNDGSITMNGNSNGIDCDHATNGNNISVNGNSNDVDLNGSNNSSTTTGQNNNTHN